MFKDWKWLLTAGCLQRNFAGDSGWLQRKFAGDSQQHIYSYQWFFEHELSIKLSINLLPLILLTLGYLFIQNFSVFGKKYSEYLIILVTFNYINLFNPHINVS